MLQIQQQPKTRIQQFLPGYLRYRRDSLGDIAADCGMTVDEVHRYIESLDAPVPSDIHTAASSSPPLLASSRERTLQPAGTTRGQAAPSRPQTTAQRMEARLAGQGRLPSDEAGGPVAPRPAPKAAPLQSTKQRMLARLVRQGRLTAEEAEELAG